MKPNYGSKPEAAGAVSVLVVLSSTEQQQALRDMLSRSAWRVICASGLDEARAKLRTERVGVVIASYNEEGSTSWRDLLDATRKMLSPPPIIVTHSSTDEWLWAEVLSEGGYDVLPQPFDPREAFFLISAAWRFWRLKNRVAISAGGFAA
jgi:DNA-binding NtrC family response regulator